MNDVPPAWVHGVMGSVHSGQGSQFNIHYQYPAGPFAPDDLRALLNDSEGKAPRAVAEDELMWLRRHFIHPRGYDRAYELLERRHTVLLDGHPGSGRTATARMLLRYLPRAGGKFLELLPDGDEEERRLDPDRVGEADQLLLDLSDADQQVWRGIQAELSGFRASVSQKRAHLVVVLPPQVGHHLHQEYAALRVEISRPPGMRLELDIIRRRLRYAGVDPTVAEPVPDTLRDYLVQRPPLREVAGLARLLCEEAARFPTPAHSFDDWCAAAVDAATRREPQVAELLEGLPQAPERALLLSAAMLHEARADSVHKASVDLLAAVGHPEDATSLLERRGLDERLRAIKAATDTRRLVRFDQLRFDEAVRHHFWDNHPDLRPSLRTWIGGALALPGLTDADRDRLVQRFAEQCCRTRRAEDLFGLVERWAGTSDRGPGIRAAAQLLKHGLEDAELGRPCRSRIYTWATGQRLSRGLRRVLISVCLEVMPVRHPYAAMVRLHHLAARETPGDEARRALVELVLGDHRLHRRMLERLASPSSQRDAVTDVSLFLELADPRALTEAGLRAFPLLAEAHVGHWLTKGWRNVFRSRPWGEWRSRAESWFDAACDGLPYGHRLLDILTAACTEDVGVQARLYASARDWARAHPHPGPERSGLPAALLKSIMTKRNLRSAVQQEAAAP
ncbi:hypothetical protein [Streptomyces sp. NPDC003036]|uniref:nSTAND3 domain-containing NTPase n=1 Tax=Streptomyces sp. NPDC003036 TaxID=3154442 RepID=UPI0033B4F887